MLIISVQIPSQRYTQKHWFFTDLKYIRTLLFILLVARLGSTQKSMSLSKRYWGGVLLCRYYCVPQSKDTKIGMLGKNDTKTKNTWFCSLSLMKVLLCLFSTPTLKHRNTKSHQIEHVHSYDHQWDHRHIYFSVTFERRSFKKHHFSRFLRDHPHHLLWRNAVNDGMMGNACNGARASFPMTDYNLREDARLSTLSSCLIQLV